jgi:hypothetical protein
VKQEVQPDEVQDDYRHSTKQPDREPSINESVSTAVVVFERQANTNSESGAVAEKQPDTDTLCHAIGTLRLE